MQDELSEVILVLAGSTFIILVLISLVVVSLLIHQKRKFRHRHELNNLTNLYEKEVLRTQLETQSQTFESISRELHDNVGTLISIGLVHLSTLTEEKHLPGKQKLEEIQHLLNEAMDILRDIARSINPANISSMGLEKTICNELEKIRKTNRFTIHYHAEGEEFPIEPRKQIILFRITQEALNNIMKHSHGNEIMVNLGFSAPVLSLLIRDNGRGFYYQPDNPTALANKSGIKNMLTRSKLIGADLRIESSIEEGTAVKLQYCDAPSSEQADVISLTH